jgi:hypothetical protein
MLFAHVINELKLGGGLQLHVFLTGTNLSLQSLTEREYLSELIQK